MHGGGVQSLFGQCPNAEYMNAKGYSLTADRGSLNNLLRFISNCESKSGRPAEPLPPRCPPEIRAVPSEKIFSSPPSALLWRFVVAHVQAPPPWGWRRWWCRWWWQWWWRNWWSFTLASTCSGGSPRPPFPPWTQSCHQIIFKCLGIESNSEPSLGPKPIPTAWKLPREVEFKT